MARLHGLNRNIRFRAFASARWTRTRRITQSLALIAISLLWAASAVAQEDFFRSSPGALSESHASIDGQDHCNDCHSGGRTVSKDKCLDCHDHKDLKAKIRAGEGYHASSKLRGRACETCHLEHKGRGYDLMGWKAVGGMDSFNHNDAGWPLEGKHASIDCKDCHKRKNRQGLRVFLGEDKLCGSCHKDDQPHGFKKRELMKCERCHNVSVWKPAKKNQDFDHNDPKDAALTLEGAHEDVRCSKCHPKAKFNRGDKDPGSCSNCHESPHDKHLFGRKKCEWCHSPKYRKLSEIQFNHGQRTRFALGGAHANQGCYKCHTKQIGEKKPNRSCGVCHADDNKHEQRFKAFGNPPQCELCHPPSSWKKPRGFAHDKRTKFDLTGRHAEVGCRSCHRGTKPDQFERFDPKTVGCMGCHQHANVHEKKFKDSQCLDCHKSAGRKQLTAKSRDIYHGPDSNFPLIAGHEGIACAKCHLDNVYDNTPKECGGRCHEDSLHRGSLGQECSRCHSSGVWTATRFDHNDDTKWPLKGMHASGPECRDCHPARIFSNTPKNCSAEGCHAKDDVHKGMLGQECERCHLETGDMRFDHNTMSQFPLEGQHLRSKCSECHPKITFKPRPKNCFGCHPEPKVHKGQYGTLCETCHTTAGWRDIKALHDVGEFALKGSHDNIPCQRCHKDNRPLGGSGNLCINCHRNDDIHSNSLSPRCGECHTQWSFAPARFEHATVGCYLTGLHRVLPCYDCHKAGNFGGLSAQCYSCHRDTAVKGGAFHQGPTYENCAGCHNTNSWANAALPYGRDSICR